MDDHAKGCAMRNVECTCGYDDYIEQLKSELQNEIICNEIVQDRLKHVEHSLLTGSEVAHERDFLAMEARRYASHYPQSSDGRNTFIMFAEMIEARNNGR